MNESEYLSSKEAFEKYDPNSDEFYTSQGLDPKEQRKIINELNSKRKPKLSDKEALNKLHKETEEAANQFYKTTKEAEDIIKEYKQKANYTASKPETQSIKDVNFDDILEDAAKETAERNSKLTNRTIQNTAKKALNTKKLGLGIAIGATVLLAGAAVSSVNKKEKKKQEEEKEKLQKTNTNNNKIDYSQNLQYAQQITNFSRGHSTYRLRG